MSDNRFECACEHGLDCTRTTMCKVQDIADELKAAKIHITALEADAAMDRGRSDAKIAVLTSVLAKLAREGQQEYAQKMLKKSDKAWMDVKPEHLVVAHVNKQEQE